MTTPQLLNDLRRFEGLKLKAYPDPLSKGPPWTIGYGHTGPEVGPGVVWTKQEAESELQRDVQVCEELLDRKIAYFRELPTRAQDGFVNLAFNLGVNGLLTFTTFLRLIKLGEFKQAADDLKTTNWFKEVNGDGRGDFVCELIAGDV